MKKTLLSLLLLLTMVFSLFLATGTTASAVDVSIVPYTGTYDGQSHFGIVDIVALDEYDTIMYSTDGYNWSDEASSITFKNAGTYDIYVWITAGDDEYYPQGQVVISPLQLSVEGTVVEPNLPGMAEACVIPGTVSTIYDQGVSVTATGTFQSTEIGNGIPVDVQYQVVGDNDGNYIAPVDEVCYGDINQAEAASMKVTTAEDKVNAADGKISLREALTVYYGVGGGTTVTFADGITELKLNSTIELTGTYEGLVIDGGSNIVFDGQKFLLFKVKNDINITFKGITFKNLNNTSSSYGSVLGCDWGLQDSDFSKKITFDSCTFSGNKGANGAAVMLTGNTGVFINCSFTQNSGAYGAIWMCYGNLSLDGCTFTENVSTSTGGAISATSDNDQFSVIAKDCIFTNNRSTSYGGAIYTELSALTLTDCTFTGNSGSAGGAISATHWARFPSTLEPVVITISGTSFNGNTAKRNGGAINAVAPRFVISDSEFVNNVAAGEFFCRGAAIYADTSVATSTITDTAFTGNSTRGTGSSMGGAIFLATTGWVPGSNYAITGCSFTNNAASADALYYGYGGAGYIAGTTTFKDCSFTGNVTNIANDTDGNGEVKGGALYIVAGGGEKVQLRNCTVTGNYAGGTAKGSTAQCTPVYGGGIYTDSPLDLIQCLIADNTVYAASGGSGYGGAISFGSSSSGTLVNNTIVGNTANEGAALFAKKGNTCTTYNNLIAANGTSSLKQLSGITLTENGCNYLVMDTTSVFANALPTTTDGYLTWIPLLSYNTSIVDKGSLSDTVKAAFGVDSSVSDMKTAWAGITDNYGNDRIYKDTIDIGACEFKYTITPYTGTFDGAQHPGVTVSGLEADATVSYIVDGTGMTSVPTFRSAGEYNIIVLIKRNGYQDYTQTVICKIERATVTISDVDAQDKIYDAKTAATIDCIAAGCLAGTNITLGYTADFENKNVGNGKTVDIKFEISGQDRFNYEIVVEGKTYTPETNKPWIVTTTDTATISKASLTVEGTTVAPKDYDGTAAADVTAGTLQDILEDENSTPDEVFIDTATGTFDEGKDAGENKAVTVIYTLSGSDADNYTVANTESTATISPKLLTVEDTSAADKTYDGTYAATVTAGTLKGFVSGDDVSLDTVTGSFDNADAETGKDVTVEYALKGKNAANYTISDETVSASIAPKELTVNGTTVSNKVYDGTAAANVTVGTLQGVIGLDDVGISTATGTFNEGKNVGEGKTVAVTYSLTGNDANNYTIEGETFTANITQRDVTLTSASDSRAYDGTPLTNSNVNFTGSGFVSGEGVDCNVTGSQISVGSSSNAYIYTAKADTELTNYAITKVEGTLTVTANTTAITVTADSASKVYDGTALTDSGYTYTGSLAAGDTFDSVTVEGTITDYGTAANEVTDYVIRNQAGDNVTEFYTGISVEDGALSITKRDVVLTSGDASKAYDGTPLTNDNVTVTGSGFVEGEGADFNVTGSQTSVGSSANTFSYILKAGTSPDNYSISTSCGTLTVGKNTTVITVTADSDSKVYDGAALTNSGYTYIGSLAAGDSFDSVTVTGTITDYGTAANTVEGYVIKNEAGDNVTAFYSGISTVNGALSITKRDVTLTSASDSKTYDGTPLTNGNVTVSGTGFVEGEGVDFNVTGSQTPVGSSANAFSYSKKAGTTLSNYNITKVEGTLTVGKNTTAITVTADSDSKTYDGVALTDSGYTYTGKLGIGDYFDSVTVEGAVTDAGTTANKVTAYVIKNQAGENVTAFYSGILTADGTLTVNPRPVTLTTDSGTKEYDGNALKAENITISGAGFVSGQGITVTDYASITGAGQISNAIVYTLNPDTVAANYDWTIVEGTLKVTPQRSDNTGTAIETLPSELKTVLEEKIEAAAEIASKGVNTAIEFNGNGIEAAGSASISKVLGANGFVQVLLKGVGFDARGAQLKEESKIVTARFDVTPYDSNGIAQTKLDESVTFRVPLISNDFYYAHVYHGKQFVKQVYITSDMKYLEISSGSFSEYSYTLTNEDLYADFSFDYTVTVEESQHGTVTADMTTVASGKTVTLTVEAEKGYTPETITVTANGKEIELTNNEDGTYTFMMPAAKVTVSATFMEDNTMLNYFFDVKATDYFYDAVLWAADNGITKGAEANYFDPNGLTTRAQLVTFLWRAAGEPVVNYAMPFTDVDEDAYYAEAVRWAASEGIVNGMTATTFAPDINVTRAQAVTILWRYAGALKFANMTANGPAPSPFEDVENDAYYYSAVLWAIGQGITNGVNEAQTLFAPDATCIRAQTVTFLYRYFVK